MGNTPHQNIDYDLEHDYGAEVENIVSPDEIENNNSLIVQKLEELKQEVIDEKKSNKFGERREFRQLKRDINQQIRAAERRLEKGGEFNKQIWSDNINSLYKRLLVLRNSKQREQNLAIQDTTVEVAAHQQDVINKKLMKYGITLTGYEGLVAEKNILQHVIARLEDPEARDITFLDYMEENDLSFNFAHIGSLIRVNGVLVAWDELRNMTARDLRNLKETQQSTGQRTQPSGSPTIATGVGDTSCQRSGSKYNSTLIGKNSWRHETMDNKLEVGKHLKEAGAPDRMAHGTHNLLKAGPAIARAIGIGVGVRRFLTKGDFKSGKGWGEKLKSMLLPMGLVFATSWDYQSLGKKLGISDWFGSNNLSLTDNEGNSFSLSETDKRREYAVDDSIEEEQKEDFLYPFMVARATAGMTYEDILPALECRGGNVVGVDYDQLRGIARAKLSGEGADVVDTTINAIDDLEEVERENGKKILPMMFRGISESYMENHGDEGYITHISDKFENMNEELKNDVIRDEIHRSLGSEVAKEEKKKLIDTFIQDEDLQAKLLNGDISFEVESGDVYLVSKNGKKTGLDFGGKKIITTDKDGNEQSSPFEINGDGDTSYMTEMLQLAMVNNTILSNYEGKRLQRRPFQYVEERGEWGGDIDLRSDDISEHNRDRYNPKSRFVGKRDGTIVEGNKVFGYELPSFEGSETNRKLYAKYLNDLDIRQHPQAETMIETELTTIIQDKYPSLTDQDEIDALVESYKDLYLEGQSLSDISDIADSLLGFVDSIDPQERKITQRTDEAWTEMQTSLDQIKEISMQNGEIILTLQDNSTHNATKRIGDNMTHLAENAGETAQSISIGTALFVWSAFKMGYTTLKAFGEGLTS